jgi:DNA-binding NtrC family response regulator
MAQIMETANRVMHSDIPILIWGEDGTGKELISRYIHFHGKYRHGRLITINCSITQETGYPQSNSNPFAQFDNHFQLARNGTLLLKEIDQLSPAAQSQIYQSLFCSDNGESATGKYRIIATARPTIKDAVARQEFLPELFYRLSVVTMEIPSLCQRAADIPLIASAFLRKFSDYYNIPEICFDMQALEKIQEYCWPGNVQEMENRIRRAVIMNQSGVIKCEDLEFPISLVRQRKTLPEVINEVQKQYLDDTLSRTRGNVTKTAKELGISRMALYDMIDRFSVQIDAYRRES